MSSRLVRVLHKILARRLSDSLPLSPRQKAFIPVDGCVENVVLLDTLIKDAKRKLKPLSLTFLDVAKAFDSVSYETTIRSMKRFGVPEPLLRYVAKSYQGTFTQLNVRGTQSAPKHCCRGVRQNDP